MQVPNLQITDKIIGNQQLGRENQQKLRNAYIQLNAGLVLQELTKGKTLGMAMYQAKTYMDNIVRTNHGQNSASEYLHHIHSHHSQLLAKQMMTHPQKDKQIACSEPQRAEYQNRATQEIQQATQQIQTIFAKYKDTKRQDNPNATEQQSRAAKFQMATKSVHGLHVQSERAANAKQSAKPAINASPMHLTPDSQRTPQKPAQRAIQLNPYMMKILMQRHQQEMAA